MGALILKELILLSKFFKLLVNNYGYNVFTMDRLCLDPVNSSWQTAANLPAIRDIPSLNPMSWWPTLVQRIDHDQVINIACKGLSKVASNWFILNTHGRSVVVQKPSNEQI